MNRYSSPITFLSDQFDALGNLLPHAILHSFQEAAGEHATLLGVGYDALAKRGLLWIILQTRYEILRMPQAHEPLTIHTWPLPATRLGYERNYLICDSKGEPLVKGHSLWGMMDAEARKLAAAGEIYPEMEFCMEKTFEERARRIRDFETDAPAAAITPKDSYIDKNGHVNNTYYPVMALEAMNGLQGILSTFQIDYLHEVLPRQTLKISFAQEENSVVAKGEDGDGQRMFACSFLY